MTDRQTYRQTGRQTDVRTYLHACMHAYIHTYIIHTYIHSTYLHCQGFREQQLHKVVPIVKNRPNAMLELGLTTNTPLFQPSGIFKIIFKRNTNELAESFCVSPR